MYIMKVISKHQWEVKKNEEFHKMCFIKKTKGPEEHHIQANTQSEFQISESN